MSSSLASLLKRYRDSAGLTQEELAERAEISTRTVSDVERGLRTRIYRETAVRLAEALALTGEARTRFETASRGHLAGWTGSMRALPIPPTRLIGREREVGAIVETLGGSEVRLVTLTGPGGIGKTRVALEAARRASFPDGPLLVDLGGIDDPRQVILEIGRAVALPGARIPTADALADHLGDRSLLLLLDTFEHVLAAALDVAELLSKTPRVAVLATSREALRIRGEREIAIPALALPSTTSVEDVQRAPATALFVERARWVAPQLEIDERAAGVIADVCRRLSGLPLAIELAAARMKHLPLERLRLQLENMLDVLVSGSRDLPARQRTMRDAIAWSYGLLDADERRAFLDLSVFSGGWTLDAAEAVTGADAQRQISGLLDKSLVVTIDHGSRWDMLDVIREFASETHRDDAPRHRHAAYFLALAEAAEPGLGSGDQRTTLAKLEREHDNIRAALRRSIDAGDTLTALRIGAAIWRFWLIHGDLSEGRAWLSEALQEDPTADPRARARATWGLAWLSYHQGDLDELERCAEDLSRLAAVTDDPVETRNALTIRGISDQALGRLDDAIAAFERGVDLLRKRGASWLLATSLLNLGTALAHTADPRARSTLEEARAMYLELGDERFAARTEVYLGYAALVEGDMERARSLMRGALVSFFELDDLWGTTEALEGITAIPTDTSNAGRVVGISAAAESLRERINMRALPRDHATFERALDRVRSELDASTWAAARDRGRSMAVDEVVDEALHLI